MPDLGSFPLWRFAIFGGISNNWLALEAVLDDAARRGCAQAYCLGDLGGAGPYPNRVFPILRDREVFVMQGNYDHSIGNDLDDCACGFTSERDNHFAALAYKYTRAKTSPEWRPWLRALPPSIRAEWAGQRVLMAHGSPRRVNEFLWESTSTDPFLTQLLDRHEADLLLVTHSGLPWQRTLIDGRQVVNVGAIGRPANDGSRDVWYAVVTERLDALAVELVSVPYDWERLAHAMRAESLPEEFVRSIESGWWTTGVEILPLAERERGRY